MAKLTVKKQFKAIGDFMKFLRKEILKLSQREFAKLAGIDDTQLSHIELGKVDLPDAKISAVCAVAESIGGHYRYCLSCINAAKQTDFLVWRKAVMTELVKAAPMPIEIEESEENE